MMARMMGLESENTRLKKMYIEEKHKAKILNEAITEKSDEAISQMWDGSKGDI